MNVIVHILVTILFIELMDITGFNLLLACFFGVLIDLDHIIKIPLYLKENGFKIVRLWNWRTPFQEPTSYMWVVPISLYLQTWIPVFFFTIHLILDYLLSYKKKPFSPFFDFEIKERTLKYDGTIQFFTVVITLCIFVFLV